MADATQVQIRRDTAANLASATPVEAELGYDQTNKRLLVGDGTTAAGIPHVNYLDDRNNTFIRGTIGGTGNAITLTLSPVPASYQNYMRIGFIATSTNTGSVTIDVNGLGVRTLQKLSGGSLVNLESGDLVSGVYYEAIYNSTVFQITTIYGSGLVSVGQGDLRVSSGSGSVGQQPSGSTFSMALGLPLTSTQSRISMIRLAGTGGNLITSVTLPGGAYGFYPRISSSGGSLATWSYNQVYITASPPYDLGDGEVGGFFFALLNPAGEIVSTYIADTPPWAYNGPTDIRPCLKCPVTGKKFRRIIKKRSLEEIMDGAPIEYKTEEITHKIKNKDMGLIPHPFGEIPDGHSVVLLDPMDDKIRRLVEYQNAGGDIGDTSKFIIDNDCCNRKCPKGVKAHKFKYKFTKKF